MRCFIAVEIDPAILSEITGIADKMRSETSLTGRDVKWVSEKNMHLTLKFLGDVEADSIDRICNGLKRIAAEHDCFNMAVRNIGSFGKPPKILWVGIENCQPLNRLQKEIENFLSSEGFPKEKKQFQAHLTLCRIKNQKAGRAISRAVTKYADMVLGTTCVTEVSVYKSKLTAVGPIYTKIDSFMLA
ncbi:MAG: RNA 2',3'-cyclic phosphodiesterase [Anaerohalosphaera sp.]|nr:RNA 2',3'-cyclic phosphodiesterase [Anaerohalosphaera sp.]